MDEDGEGEFTFFIYPTTRPNNNVTVDIVASAARDENFYLTLNGIDKPEILRWTEGDMLPQKVTVAYNTKVQELDVTEKNLILLITMNLE